MRRKSCESVNYGLLMKQFGKFCQSTWCYDWDPKLSTWTLPRWVRLMKLVRTWWNYSGVRTVYGGYVHVIVSISEQLRGIWYGKPLECAPETEVTGLSCHVFAMSTDRRTEYCFRPVWERRQVLLIFECTSPMQTIWPWLDLLYRMTWWWRTSTSRWQCFDRPRVWLPPCLAVGRANLI